MGIFDADHVKDSPTESTWRPQQVDCVCGYAESGVVPDHLCPECGDRIVGRWVDAERGLLSRVPEYAEQVAEILELTQERQRKALARGGEDLFSHVDGQVNWGGRRLSRLPRKHREEIAALDMRDWQRLSEPLTHDRRENVRRAAARSVKRGLGAAALTRLAVRGLTLTIDAVGREAERRKNR